MSDARKQVLQQELQRLLPRIIADYTPEKIILFGSLATGHLHEWSDLDLAIIKKTNKRFLDRIADVMYIANPSVGCDIVVYTPDELSTMQDTSNAFIHTLLRDGQTIYDASE